MSVHLTIRRAAIFALDILEKHLPAAMLLVLVAVFLVQIIFRYFFTPLIWPDELLGYLFLWLVLFAAGFAERERRLIRFSLFHDLASTKTRRLMGAVGHAILVTALVILVWPAWQYIEFMMRRSSPVFPIAMGLIYAPFLFFLVAMIIRFSARLVHDVRAVFSRDTA